MNLDATPTSTPATDFPTTPELRHGDVIRLHGMTLLLDRPIQRADDHPAGPVFYTSALVCNPTEVRRDGFVPWTWLTEAPGTPELPRWTVQGNHLAHWVRTGHADLGPARGLRIAEARTAALADLAEAALTPGPESLCHPAGPCTDSSHSSLDCYPAYVGLEYPDGGPVMSYAEWRATGELDADEPATLGPCGCTDYHLADCPTRAPATTEAAESDPYGDDV